MRILVIPSWYPPNEGWFFKEHAIALAAGGQQVDVLAGIYASIRKTHPLKWFASPTINMRPEENIREFIRLHPIIPFSEKLNFHSWVSMMLSFFDQYIQQWGKPHIIQVHSSMWAGVVAARIKKQYQIPYVITEHRSRFVYNTIEAKKMFRPWYTAPLAEAFKEADAIITVSSSLHDKIIDICPEAKEKPGIIYNMVDVDFFKPSNNPLPPERTFKLFSLAHLEPVKGIDTLLQAFAILNQKFPGEFHLCIGGDGSLKDNLIQYCAAKNISQQVTFLGKLSRDQVREAFLNANAFVLPSRFEAFGVVFIEAMACGIPVIAARSGGPDTFITPQTGKIVDPDQPRELADAIYQLKSNHQQYSPNNIRQYAIRNFSKEEIAEKYIQLYTSIINKNDTGKQHQTHTQQCL